MTTVEERAPLTIDLDPEAREKLRDGLAKAEAIATQLAQTYRDALALLDEPAVDLGDPLAMFRLPSGAVGYETDYADSVVVGDWVQRCHGDPDWHLVEDVEDLRAGGTDWVRITYDGLAHDWKATDAIRVARPPADVIARQEQREAGR